jgi:voltage-gated potassium channel
MVSTFRKRVAVLLQASHADDKPGRVLDFCLMSLILLNVIAIVMGSVSSFYAAYQPFLYQFEVFSVVVFTVEYIARVWSCIDCESSASASGLKGRLRYMLSPLAIIDLIAILPFYLSFFFAIDLRFLRIFRLFRILKLTRYSGALAALLAVLQEESKTFFAAFFVLVLLLLFSSCGIFLIEQDVQPEVFGSIPAAMWWAMSTLTTVGYGDVTPITPMGKLFGGFITLIGTGMVALPAGIIAAGFAQQMRRRREEYNQLVERVVEDGVVTHQEQQQLAELRQALNVNEEDAALLMRAAEKNIDKLELNCPHCEKPLSFDTVLKNL